MTSEMILGNCLCGTGAAGSPASFCSEKLGDTASTQTQQRHSSGKKKFEDSSAGVRDTSTAGSVN